MKHVVCVHTAMALVEPLTKIFQELIPEAANGTVELPQLPAGVYAVKIGNQGSTLIRL